MKKNTIRLTESDLRRVISESVNKVLTEINWKTPRNAAEKNREREEEYRQLWWDIERQIQSAYEKGDLDTVKKLKLKQNAVLNKSLRTSDFESYANQKFNDEFFKNSHDRFNANDGKGAAPFKRTDDGSYSTDEPYMDEYGNIHGGRVFGPHGKVNGKHFDDIISYQDLDRDYSDEFNGEDNSALSDDDLRKMGFPDNEINDIEKARREIRRYRNGDYKFDKNKGWYL